ncbi:hypothetical protein FO519_000893 [Halicephalobus sp. NKZ332]|nr:hypothetical protein FO519_000893 [Halicephalobus sp. NKZ332]
MNFALLLIFVALSSGQETSINMEYLLDSPSAGGDVQLEGVLMKESIDITLLNCTDFDGNCRWHNLRDSSVDLKWYQSSAYLDPSYFQLATGSQVLPTSFYAVAASDDPSKNDSTAVLMSEVVSCPTGTDQFSLMYWLSPWVKLTICIKSNEKAFPNYDFCSNLPEEGSPGPVNVVIPAMENMTFQVFIIASNFTYQDENFRGGFAILDNVTIADGSCTRKPVPSNDYEDMILTSIFPIDDFETAGPVLSHSTANPTTTTTTSIFTIGGNTPNTTTTIVQTNASNAGGMTTTTAPIMQTTPGSSANNISNSTAGVQVTSVKPVITPSMNSSTTATTSVPTANVTSTVPIIGAMNNTINASTTNSSTSTTTTTPFPLINPLMTTGSVTVNPPVSPITSASNSSTMTATLPFFLTTKAITEFPIISTTSNDVGLSTDPEVKTSNVTITPFQNNSEVSGITNSQGISVTPKTGIAVVTIPIVNNTTAIISELMETTPHEFVLTPSEFEDPEPGVNSSDTDGVIRTTTVKTVSIPVEVMETTVTKRTTEKSSGILKTTTQRQALEVMETTPMDLELEPTSPNTESSNISITTRRQQDAEIVMETTPSSHNNSIDGEVIMTSPKMQMEITTSEQNPLTLFLGSTARNNPVGTFPANEGEIMETTPNSREMFAFISGPIRWSRILTPPFELSDAGVFNFDYRTALDNVTICTFTVFVKRNDTIIETILSIPAPFSDSSPTSWRNASALLLGGAYEYIAFEVRNLEETELIGIDNFRLTEFLGGNNFC